MQYKANMQIRSSCIQTADKIINICSFSPFFFLLTAQHHSDQVCVATVFTLSLPAACSDSGKRLKFDGLSVWNQLQNQQTLNDQII